MECAACGTITRVNGYGYYVDTSGTLSKALGAFPQGCKVFITIRENKPRRSHAQNAYWHATPFPMIAEFCGTTIEETKYFLMGECFGWTRINGRDVPVKPSTSEMSVEEGTYFTDWLIPWAVEHCDGMQIPLPNEYER